MVYVYLCYLIGQLNPEIYSYYIKIVNNKQQTEGLDERSSKQHN